MNKTQVARHFYGLTRETDNSIAKMVLHIVFLLVLIMLYGVFSMAEIAIISARKAILQERAQKGNHGARAALILKEDPHYFLSLIQTILMFLSIIIGVYGGMVIGSIVVDWLAQYDQIAEIHVPLGFTIAILLVSCVALVLGEFVPKQYAANRAEKIAVQLSSTVLFLGKILYPFIGVLDATTRLLIRTMRITTPTKPQITEEEIRLILQEAQAGILEKEEHERLPVFPFR